MPSGILSFIIYEIVKNEKNYSVFGLGWINLHPAGYVRMQMGEIHMFAAYILVYITKSFAASEFGNGLTASPSDLCRFYQYWVGKLTEVTYQDTKKEQENKDALASFLPCSFVSVAYIIYLLR